MIFGSLSEMQVRQRITLRHWWAKLGHKDPKVLKAKPVRRERRRTMLGLRKATSGQPPIS